MAEIAVNKMIKVGMVLAVVVITIVFIAPNFSKLYAGMVGWNNLDQDEKQEITDKFNVFTANLEECKKTDDKNCTCKDAFQNFPNTFRKEVSIEFLEGKGAKLNITLLYNGKDVGVTKTIEGIQIRSVYKKENKKLIEIEKTYTNTDKHVLEFSEKYPTIEGKKDYKLVIPIKAVFDIISADIFRGDSKSVLYFIIENVESGEENSIQAEFFNEYLECDATKKVL